MIAGRRGARTWGLVHVAAAGVLVVLLAAARATDVATADLARDPTAVLDGPFHTGVLSSLGILGWTTAAAVSGFGASLVEGGHRRFLAATSALTGILAIDDLLLIHDEVAPDHLGIHENVVLVLLAGAAAAYGIVYRRQLLSDLNHAMLGVSALAWFAASAFLDLIADDAFGDQHFFVEDGCKFLGIVSWAAFVVVATRARALSRSATAPR